MAGLRSERVVFRNRAGLELAALMDRPAEPPRAWGVFAHCFTCSKDVKAAAYLSRALAEQGFGVLRFDFTGLGGSEGEFSETNFSSNIDDLVDAVGYLAETRGPPSLLVGHSLGGAAVLMAAERLPSIRAVATVGAPSDPEHLTHLFAEKLETIRGEGCATVILAGRTFAIKRQFVEDLRQHPLKERLPRLRKALLVCHAPTDSVVDIKNASEIFQAARHPKSFVSLDGADHLLSEPADARFAAEMIAAWARRYAPEPKQDEGAAEGARDVVVVEQGGRLTQRIRAGGHYLVADEPEAVGGHDLGPDPYQLLLSGLGACTSMTIRMYANHKRWPVEGIRVRLRHEKIHAKDCRDCESRAGKVDLIHRDIEITGPLDAEQRARLLEIADRCPVHRSLRSENRIRSRLVDSIGAEGA